MSPPQLARSTPDRGKVDPTFDASLACAFNALVRETSRWTRTPEGDLSIETDEGRLIVPCRRLSEAGRHAIEDPIVHETADGRSRLGLVEALRRGLEATDLADEGRESFLSRVLRSRRNLEHAVEDRREDLDRLFGEPLSFRESEQALLVGHSMHPCPKDRGRLSLTDAERFAPEHEAAFPLVWLAVDETLLTHWSGPTAAPTDPLEDLTRSGGLAAHRRSLERGERLVPCHPHQLEHWQAHPRLADALEDGSLRVLGQGPRTWYPTTSLRTLYAPDADWQVKFSLSVKLTNSLRHLHPDELARGPQIAEAAQTGPLAAFEDRFEAFELVREPTSWALTDSDGEPVDATGIAWRRDPWAGDPANTDVLATLLQDDPRNGQPRLAQRLLAAGQADEGGEWFERFLDVVVEPLLTAQADHGVIAGAHQQNLVLDLDGIEPQRAWYRDCQGIGFSPLARERFPELVADLEERGALVFDEEKTRVLTTYYLVVNSVFNTISSLAALDGVTEADLLERFADRLARMRSDGVREPIVLDHLLEADELHIKGNLHYAVTGVNETTQEADLLAFYRPVANPIREVAP